jgi:hypothetical protein
VYIYYDVLLSFHYFPIFVSDDPEVEPALQFMFRASEEYGLADLSPAAYLDFIERCSTQTNFH